MMERVFLCLALAVFFVSFPGTSRAEKKIYINGIDANFPPFAYLDEDGKPDGFDVKALDWIAAEMGFEIRHHPTEWHAIIPSLLEKSIDLVASGMSITEETKKQVNFTMPYWTIQQVIIAGKDCAGSVDQILSRGGKLALIRGSNEAEWIEDNLGKKRPNLALVYYDSISIAIEDMLGGRVTAVAVNEGSAQDAVKKNPLRIVGPFGMPDEKFGYAVRKEDIILLHTLNCGLKRLMSSPYWEELKRKYIDEAQAEK